MRRKERDMRKYKYVKARKTYECIVCGKKIVKGTEHFVLPIHSKRIANRIAEELETFPWEIKVKTRLFFFDSITLRFCSSECFIKYWNFNNNLPDEVRERIRKKEDEIIEKTLESIKLAYKLS